MRTLWFGHRSAFYSGVSLCPFLYVVFIFNTLHLISHHYLCWWVMRWWRRVTCYPIQKYWPIGYWRRCMYQMYRRCQYLFYCTNIVWIINWSDICWIGCYGLIRFGVIWINMSQVGIYLILNHRIFAPNFFNFEINFALRIFEFFFAFKVFH